VAAEGGNGVSEARFTLRLGGAQANPVTVSYATEDGTAIAGEDYVATNGTITFAPGELSKIVTVILTADAARSRTRSSIYSLPIDFHAVWQAWTVI
jgi:hypothetical protein